jgi:uncharacterized protein YndB with AHSA1/START domain
MIDITRELDAVQREVTDAQLPSGAARTIRLQRDYDAPIEDVWDALTDPERIGRWFLPISGDYRLGGTYQFEGNAGGDIVACERPNRLKVTWVYGPVAEGTDPSEVEIRLSTVDGGAMRFDFRHTATVPEEMWTQFGPGAVGVGWDGGVLGLSLYLRGGSIGDSEAWQVSEEGREFYKRASEAWGRANLAAGADPDTAAQGVANTTQFYAPDPAATS